MNFVCHRFHYNLDIDRLFRVQYRRPITGREQECQLKFGSWTYDGFKLDISLYGDRNEVDVGDYIESNEWELVDHPGRRNVRYYTCCSDNPFPDLTFNVRLRRMTIFYNYILILPCVLLSVLTMVIFWLPPESPAKMMLGYWTRLCFEEIVTSLQTIFEYFLVITRLRNSSSRVFARGSNLMREPYTALGNPTGVRPNPFGHSHVGRPIDAINYILYFIMRHT